MVVTILLLLIISGVGAVPFIFFVHWVEPHNMPICLSSYLVCATSWILTLLLLGWFARKAERERISNMRKDGLSENMIVLTNEKNN